MAVPSEESSQHQTTALEPATDPQENGGIEQSNDAVEAILESVASDKDPKHEVPEPESLPSGSNEESTGQPELKKDEGSKTFTMRELLNGLKGDQSQSGNSTPVAPVTPLRFFSLSLFLRKFQYDSCLISYFLMQLVEF